MTTDSLRAKVERLINPILETPHAECDDCWYSCPKSGACCDDREQGPNPVCRCGKDALDTILREVLALL